MVYFNVPGVDVQSEILRPVISVIVSIYNVQNYVEKSVQSIQKQTYKNLEIILVDDGSTDNSGKICDEFAKKDTRIKVIHKANGGLSSARNEGIKIATGEYIAFVDGDDWIDETMYEDMLGAILSSKADLAICNYKEVSKNSIRDNSTDKITVFEGREVLKVFIEEDVTYQIQNAAWNKLYKRNLMGDLRFPEGKLFEDIVYTTKLLAKSKRSVYLDKAYYNYIFDRSDSIMNSKKVERLLTDQVPAYKEKGEFLLSIGEKDLFLTHQFFFYKRMLLHYKDAKQKKPEGYQTFLKKLQKVICEKPVCWDAFAGHSKGEWLRMKLFTISPMLYYGFTMSYENYVVPYKQLKNAQNEPLVVIQLSGGMGNQMFQYALYLQLKALGRNVKIDDKTEYEGRDNARPIRLDVFDAKYVIPTKEEMTALTDSYLDAVSRIRRKLTGRKTAEYKEQSPVFEPQVLQKERAYLVGCWQSEKYFHEVKEEVRKAFTFQKIELSEKMQKYKEDMENSNSVCVHIRRGDYLDVDEVYGGICTEEYYAKAMKKMEEEISNCQFFIFTNDVPWVKEHMQGENITVVEGNDEDAGYIDMYLMTQCKHYIMANSSFSWWGCYLSASKEKKVIAPKIWANGRDCRDLYTDEMNTCI